MPPLLRCSSSPSGGPLTTRCLTHLHYCGEPLSCILLNTDMQPWLQPTSGCELILELEYLGKDQRLLMEVYDPYVIQISCHTDIGGNV